MKEFPMKKAMLAAVSAVTAMSFALSAVSVEAQPRDRGDRWERDHRGDGRWDRGDRRDRRDDRRWRSWDNRSGWNGYRGSWRQGQRYNNWRSSRYYLNDWRGYGLPAPRPGYRYYRDGNGDIVMAAIATGIIASILTR
jgi:Ni/Co efflux regulator RcnB